MIEFIGLGPMNGVSLQYEASIVAHLDWVVMACNEHWVARLNGKPIEIVVNFSQKEPRSRIRVVNRANRCFSSIQRAARSTRVPDAAELARQDVIDWLEAVRRRFELDPWPELPSMASFEAEIGAYRAPSAEW